MIIILSQKIDTESSYSGDQVFHTYHYPNRYKNQIHSGDTFVYYQGNRYDKTQRYYFGTGSIGEIKCIDCENYYAQLLNVEQFEQKVPIYLPDGGYIEQLGYQSVRKSINPPWQSSIRPLSKEAYQYIIQMSGNGDSVEACNAKLKKAVREYFVSGNEGSILDIINIAQQLAKLYDL